MEKFLQSLRFLKRLTSLNSRTMFRNLNYHRWIIASVALLGLFLVICILSVSYSASIALFLGIILGLLIRSARFLIRILKSKTIEICFILLLFFIISVFFSLYIVKNSVFHSSTTVLLPAVKLIDLEVESYKITIDYQENNSSFFQVEEIAKLNPKIISKNISLISNYKHSQKKEQRFDESSFKELKLEKDSLHNLLSNPVKENRLVGSTNIGLLVREVFIKPFNSNYSPCINLEELHNSICFPDNLKFNIELDNFPSGTFYQAYNGENITSVPYLSTETIDWILPDIKKGIKFAYFPTPYNYLRGFITPFLGLISTSKWIIVAVGGIISFLFKPLSKQIINTSGGNYNERIQGDYIQGDYTTISQDFSEAGIQIQQLLHQLQNQGLTTEEAQQQVAQDLAKKANNDLTVLGKLVKWRQLLGNTPANTTVTEAAKEVFKIALRLSGIPIP